MRRAETFWQGIVLFLLFLTVVGIYTVLGWLVHRIRTGQEAIASIQPTQANHALQIVEPLDGSILSRSPSVTVRSVLMESGFLQAWLQVDGRAVAVEVNPDPGAAIWNVQWAWEGASEGSHVLGVQAIGGDERVETSSVAVTVVPDGNLVFSSNREGAYAIYTMAADGRNPVRLTGVPGDARQPAPRRDGMLAFVAATASGQSVIRQLGQDGGPGADLFPGVDPTWALDGVRLACAANMGGISQVYIALTDSGSPGQVTDEEVYAGQPTWSPDGMHLAYVAERDGNWDIWLTALEDSEPRRLTDDPARDWAPAWSPDGNKLAFVSDRGGSHQIYVMRPDGMDVRLLTNFSLGAESPAWSPDGSWLALVAYTGEGLGINAREIYLMRPDGQNQVRLTYNSFDDAEVEWMWMP